MAVSICSLSRTELSKVAMFFARSCKNLCNAKTGHIPCRKCNVRNFKILLQDLVPNVFDQRFFIRCYMDSKRRIDLVQYV